MGLRLLGGFPKQVSRVTSLIKPSTKEHTKSQNQPINQLAPTNRSPLTNRVKSLAGALPGGAREFAWGGGPLELDGYQDLLIAIDGCWTSALNDLTPAAFRDRAAGWVVSGVAAPFVRILEVRDPTPEELAEVED